MTEVVKFYVILCLKDGTSFWTIAKELLAKLLSFHHKSNGPVLSSLQFAVKFLSILTVFPPMPAAGYILILGGTICTFLGIC